MSLISYFGGKSSNVFIQFINSKIPKDGSIKTYLEPFSGSFATYMDDDSLKFEQVIYNDKNRHQVNLYKCSSEPQKFVTYLENLSKPGNILYTDLKSSL
jgi:site-specific DNA-adenine methylase